MRSSRHAIPQPGWLHAPGVLEIVKSCQDIIRASTLVDEPTQPRVSKDSVSQTIANTAKAHVIGLAPCIKIVSPTKENPAWHAS